MLVNFNVCSHFDATHAISYRDETKQSWQKFSLLSYSKADLISLFKVCSSLIQLKNLQVTLAPFLPPPFRPRLFFIVIFGNGFSNGLSRQAFLSLPAYGNASLEAGFAAQCGKSLKNVFLNFSLKNLLIGLGNAMAKTRSSLAKCFWSGQTCFKFWTLGARWETEQFYFGRGLTFVGRFPVLSK